jgi:hypothetical protein
VVDRYTSSRRVTSMRRTTLFILLISALTILSSAAVFADSATTTPATPGWLKASEVGSYASQVTADAQTLVGLSTDQLTTEMGPTSLISSDGQGGKLYFYQVSLEVASGGLNEADEWFDVDSTGKVISASVDVV